jgi:Bacteriophage probable baseplate hub protein
MTLNLRRRLHSRFSEKYFDSKGRRVGRLELTMRGGSGPSRKVFMRFFERSSELVEARGKTVGLLSLRSGVKLDIRGLGARFSGTYLVTSTTHTIGDGGYTTEFSARMQRRKTKPMVFQSKRS